MRGYRTLHLLSRMSPVKSTTRTLHCFLLFQYISIIYLWKIFIQQFRHENLSVNSAFLTGLFIRTNKDPNFVPSGHSVGIPYAFCRHLSILVLKTLRHSRQSCTWGTWLLKGTWGLEVLFSADSRVLRSQAFLAYLLSFLTVVIESSWYKKLQYYHIWSEYV